MSTPSTINEFKLSIFNQIPYHIFGLLTLLLPPHLKIFKLRPRKFLLLIILKCSNYSGENHIDAPHLANIPASATNFMKISFNSILPAYISMWMRNQMNSYISKWLIGSINAPLLILSIFVVCINYWGYIGLAIKVTIITNNGFFLERRYSIVL